MIARTTPASRPSPSRGGLRPAWTPTPHTRTSTHARKTRKTAPAHPNQDLTGPAPFMDDQHRQDEKCPLGRSRPGPEEQGTFASELYEISDAAQPSPGLDLLRASFSAVREGHLEEH